MPTGPVARGAALWSVIVGLQVVAAELNFALIVDEGSRADDVRRLLQALLFVGPAAMISVRSADVGRALQSLRASGATSAAPPPRRP